MHAYFGTGHINDDAPLPDDLLQCLINARNANVGMYIKGQVLLGTFDNTIHTRPAADTTQIYGK